MAQLWNGALTILNGDEREWKQMVPRDLDDEEYYGREHIMALMTIRTDLGAFIRLVHPFLLVITHPSFLDCLSVDIFVGGLYSFVSGTNGTRAVPFFQLLCENLVGADALKTPLAIAATVDTTLAAASTALHELLRRESRAIFNDDLPTLIDSMENALEVLTGSSQSQIATVVLRRTGEVRAMVARATGLLIHEAQQQVGSSTVTAIHAYPRTLEMPRDRHDNDKADITKIQIFPTNDELLSDATDFLPSTDLNQPHFHTDQAARHIDTHFRLLRHDTFAEMKNVLGGIMHAVKNEPSISRLDLGDFRANQYPDAYISYVSFDRRRGLEMHISFSQPSIVRKKTPSERRKWWEESKRLAEGVLLSLISRQEGTVQHLFLIVTQRNTHTSTNHNLSDKEHRGTIAAKLVRHDQTTLESAIRSSCQKARGTLIEFPGVVPATFTPVLENLQDMQRLSRLPFRQWILPDRISDASENGKIDIPPPLYARRPGFSFSLKPILRPDRQHDKSISIFPASSANDPTVVDEMEANTDLDRGQCRALFAALTREFAFIQGPPGTGKSYVGVQLMKVLMHLKETVNLGPVVVV